MAGELDFAIDLETIRERLRALSYFTDIQRLKDAMIDLSDGVSGIPPLAYVSTASETAEPNKFTTAKNADGTSPVSQRVGVRISVLFCIPAERADGRVSDEVEEARKAIIRILLGWTPGGAEKALEYDRFLLRASRDGLIWGEVLMATSYRLTLAP